MTINTFTSAICILIISVMPPINYLKSIIKKKPKQWPFYIRRGQVNDTMELQLLSFLTSSS